MFIFSKEEKEEEIDDKPIINEKGLITFKKKKPKATTVAIEEVKEKPIVNCTAPVSCSFMKMKSPNASSAALPLKSLPKEPISDKKENVKISIDPALNNFQPTISRKSQLKPNPGQDKAKKVQEQIDEVLEIMRTNVGKVIVRGERLETLKSKTANLEMGASKFKKNAKAVKQKILCQAWRMWLCLVLVIITILSIIAVLLYLFRKSIFLI